MQVIDYHRDTGHKPGLLVEEGRKYLHILLNEDTHRPQGAALRTAIHP